MSDDTETCVIATGPLATGVIETVDQIEPQFMTFVRGSALRLDPTFPQSGERGNGQKGQWTNDDGQQTLFTQVEEFDSEGRGIRVIRYVDLRLTEDDPYKCAITVAAIGLANGATLTLRWNFVTSGEVRGTSAALFVSGVGKEQCIADFRDVFDVPVS